MEQFTRRSLLTLLSGLVAVTSTAKIIEDPPKQKKELSSPDPQKRIQEERMPAPVTPFPSENQEPKIYQIEVIDYGVYTEKKVYVR